MKAILILGFLIVVSCVPTKERKTYDHYSVVRVIPHDRSSLLAIHKFQTSHPELDFWRESSMVDLPVDIMISPKDQSRILQELHQAGFHPEVIIPNVQRLIDNQKLAPEGGKMAWEDYQSLDTIYDWLDSLPFLYPDVVSNQTIGSSYLGKDLKLVRFNKESGQPKMAAFIDASIHPREWITLAALTWIMNELLTNPAHERILDEYDLHFLPIVNPDGLEYTESIDRLWRKTVSYYGSPFGCIGADANRNFDFHWNEGGSSEDMCSDMYHGPTPASEAETAALSDYILDNMSQFDFKLFLNLHSFAQLVLFPWSFSETHTDDYDELMEVADILASALEERHGTEFISGTAPDTLFIASGTSIDWAKGVAGIKYSYGIEMRDTGVWGLLLPPDQIIPSGEETLDGLIALLDAVRERSL